MGSAIGNLEYQAARVPPEAVFGRERELSRIEAVLHNVDGPRAVLVEGPPGIGKTTVWREALQMARRRFPTVLWCRPVEAEASLAFGGLIDLFEGVPDTALSVLPEPQRAALLAALLRGPAVGVSPDPLAVAAAARGAFVAMSSVAPLAIAVDDLQWLDPSTTAVLAYLTRRMSAEPVALLLAVRAGTEGSRNGLALPPTLRLERIDLAPLSLSSLHHIIRDRTGLVLARPMLHRIAQASGGNPFYAIEVATAAAESQTLPGIADPLPMPANLAELVALRLRYLPRPTQAALLVAALLAHPTASLLERISGVSVTDLLAPAFEAGIAEQWGERVAFAHPLFAEGIVQLAGRSERRAVHARIATAVSDPEEVARHLALAALGPNADTATAIETGARAARARGSLRGAAELFDHAASFTPESHAEERQRRSFEAAEAYVFAGDRRRAAALVDGLDENVAAEVRGRALGLRAEILANDGHVEASRRLLTDVLEHISDPHIAAKLNLDLLYLSVLELDLAAARRHGEQAVASAGAAGDCALMAEAKAFASLAAFLHGSLVAGASIEEAVRLDDGSRPPYMGLPPVGVAGLLSGLSGDHDAAVEQLAEARGRLERLGDECDLAHVHLWASWVEMRAGRLSLASEHANTASTIAEMTGSQLIRRWAVAQAALVEANRGNASRAAELIGDVTAEPSPVGLLGVWVAAAGGLAALSRAEYQVAWSALEVSVTTFERAMPVEPSIAFVVPDGVEALVGVGDLDRAETLASMFELNAQRVRRHSALAAIWRGKGLISAARGDLPAARDQLAASAELAEELAMPVEGARSRLALGIVERRLGERRAARDNLTRAAAAFQGVGANGWGERAKRELTRVPIKRGGDAELTPAERCVAELSGAGRTNRDVATALFVSAKTVEANLARIYRKLGITTRAELGAWLVRERNRGALPKS